MQRTTAHSNHTLQIFFFVNHAPSFTQTLLPSPSPPLLQEITVLDVLNNSRYCTVVAHNYSLLQNVQSVYGARTVKVYSTCAATVYCMFTIKVYCTLIVIVYCMRTYIVHCICKVIQTVIKRFTVVV